MKLIKAGRCNYYTQHRKERLMVLKIIIILKITSPTCLGIYMKDFLTENMFYYSTISKLEALEELNISSNNLSHFPASLCKHKRLQILRANCNRIRELPVFKEATELKVMFFFVVAFYFFCNFFFHASLIVKLNFNI